MLINRIKLAKMLLKLASVDTDKGQLIYEGELAVDIEVFIESNGEIVVPEDGEYTTEDKVLIVSDGKITEIRNKEELVQEDTQQTEDQITEQEKKITELEKIISEKDKEIEDLKAKLADKESELKEKDEQLNMSDEKPAKEKIKENEKQGALRFF